MPFIGQQPVTGAYHKLDSITASATATYNLQLNGGAYSPASANHLLVSLNGVIQAPQDSFTVSGSTITFASALTASDNIDFIMAFGDVLSVGTPTDGSVNTSQLANSAVTSAKLGTGAAQANISAGTITASQLATTLDLSGKTVTYGLTRSDMPAGSMLNYQWSATGDFSAYTSTTGGYADTITDFTYTPVSDNSTLLVYLFTNAMLIGTGTSPSYTFSRARLKIDGTVYNDSIVESGVRWDNLSPTKETSTSHTLFATHTNSSTSSKTIVLQANTDDCLPTSGFTVRWGERTGRSSCLVIEVAN